jgi:hypothetical protein
MKNLRLILVLAALCLYGTKATAQGFFTIDLSTIDSHPGKTIDEKSGVTTISEEWPGDNLEVEGVRLLNTLYGYDYSVSIGKTTINEINPPFSLGSGQVTAKKKELLDSINMLTENLAPTAQQRNELADLYFARLRLAAQELFSAATESEIPARFDSLRNICTDIFVQGITATRKADSALLDSCKKLVAERPKLDFAKAISASNNDHLIIRISRSGRTLVYKLKLPAKQQRWFVHYGFTYSPDVFSPARMYYSRADTGSSFLIARMHGRNGNFLDNLSPTLQFSYRLMPNRFMLSPAIVGGFSLNFSQPSAMLGFGCLVGDNLSVNVGVIGMQRYFLKGEYTDNQRITENKSFDDLHTKHFVPELCFSIGFRLEENPFKAADK